MRRPRVDILFVEHCPNHEPARALVERIAGELQVEADIRAIEVRALAQAQELSFLGSPTIRVDGGDVEPGADRRRDFTLACRVYPGPARPCRAACEAWVREALRAAAR
jgi:hypothetical protein